MSFEARFATIGEAYGASLTNVADPEKQAFEEARDAADARQSDFCVTHEAERVAKLEDAQADEALKRATTRKEETQRRLIEARAAKQAAAEAATKARAEQKDAAAKALRWEYETWLRERDAMVHCMGRRCATTFRF